MDKERIYKLAVASIQKEAFALPRYARPIAGITLGLASAGIVASSLMTHKHLEKNKEYVSKWNEHLKKLPATDKQKALTLVKQMSDKLNTKVRIIYPETLDRKDLHYLKNIGLDLGSNLNEAKDNLNYVLDHSGGGMAAYKLAKTKVGYMVREPSILLKPGAPASVVKHELGHLHVAMKADTLTPSKAGVEEEEKAWRAGVGARKTKAEEFALGSYQTAHEHSKWETRKRIASGVALTTIPFLL